ncbi:Oligopeptide transport system permease protein OppB-like protein [Fictibacillus macauensis ZFHKF-1]|uniref:Oligopeptide transport system permease protein OppB-like protein n=1 Tax=Fictibacillus macauensis ZFHKF-1 TaxID=1196324 RepID=I8AFB4_9BACL|nr:ABC transporter permease subunit [Fictibacillus macauensis]EIT84322.1 Oligopeptide transport system permease protein OppB-like protein [Fictibacillus macauensis ZFHKF-1]
MRVIKLVVVFCITFCLIVLISAAPSLFTTTGEFDFNRFFGIIQRILYTFIHWQDATFIVGTNEFTIYPDIFEHYEYMMILLISAIACALALAMLLVFFVLLMPQFIRKTIATLFSLLNSIPDVFFIFSLQLIVIWIYKQTGVLFIDPLATTFDPVYLFPILALTIFPAIFLFQLTLHSFSEELTKPYVEFAQGKGLSHFYILLHHVFRNTLLSLFQSFKQLFWFMLGNLLVIEYIFNIQGFMSFFQTYYSPELFSICLLMLFLTFFFFFYLMEGLVASYNKKRGIVTKGADYY